MSFLFGIFLGIPLHFTNQSKQIFFNITLSHLFKMFGSFGFGCDGSDLWGTDQQPDETEIRAKLSRPGPNRVWYIRYAMLAGLTVDDIFNRTKIDRWFLAQIQDIVAIEMDLDDRELSGIDARAMYNLKRRGFSDRRLAYLLKSTEQEVRQHRHALGVRPVYKRVDTCAAEFATSTAYMYSSYDDECEAEPTARKKATWAARCVRPCPTRFCSA